MFKTGGQQMTIQDRQKLLHRENYKQAIRIAITVYRKAQTIKEGKT